MMLHNLFYIAFRKEDIKTINTCDDIGSRTNSQRGGTVNAGCPILGTNVTYTAHKQVKLMPGFSATSSGGKKFIANTMNRSGEYNGSLYVAPPSYNTSAPAMASKNKTSTDNQPNANVKDDQLSIDNSDRIEIYPNPCQGKFVISVSYNHFPIDYTIVNSNGLIVKKGQIMSNGQMVDISVQPKGLYFVNLFLKDKTKSKKIVLI